MSASYVGGGLGDPGASITNRMYAATKLLDDKARQLFDDLYFKGTPEAQAYQKLGISQKEGDALKESTMRTLKNLVQ
jgi:hypothetical protein